MYFFPQFLEMMKGSMYFFPKFLDETYASGCISSLISRWDLCIWMHFSPISRWDLCIWIYFCHFSKKNYIYYIPLFLLHPCGQIWAMEQASDVFYRKRRMWLMYLFSDYLVYLLFSRWICKWEGKEEAVSAPVIFQTGAPEVKEEMSGLRLFYFWSTRVVQPGSFHFWAVHP
jgi:hypothetical protein